MPDQLEVVPTRAQALWLNAAGLGATVAGLVLGVVWFAASGELTVEIDLVEVLLTLALTIAVVVVHEAVHALAMLGFGVTPRFGFVRVGGVMPAIYTTSVRPHAFDRPAYLAIALAPFILVNSALLVVIVTAGSGGLLVVPFAVHLGGCVGDLWLVRQARSQPVGSRFEDLRDGLLVHLP